MGLEVGADAVSEEGFDDLLLGGDGLGMAGAAATGVLDGQVEGGGPGFVWGGGIGASLEEALDSGGATVADGAVEGRSAVGVLGVEAGAVFQEEIDGGDLVFGVPGGAWNEAISRVVERGAVAVVAGGVGIGSRGQQELDAFGPIASGGEVRAVSPA